LKLLTVVGARPQFIKAAALSRAINKSKLLQQVLVHTGQHYDDNMSSVFFTELDIPKPDYELNINVSGQGAMTGQMLENLEEVMMKEQPDKVIVFGDTNSTLAGALAASKLHVPIAHVEAGMRSFDITMPEEINRILTDRVSKQLFCSTNAAVNNLKNEGFGQFDCEIIQTGDIMYDALLYYEEKAANTSLITAKFNEPYILATLHRAGNTDDPVKLKQIAAALSALNKEYEVVLPLHPRTRKMVREYGIQLNCTVIDPVSYFDMIMLLKNSLIVLTDSGGVQKEAYFLKRYCVTLRGNTEWTELVDYGYNILAGSDTEKIIQSSLALLNKAFVAAEELYGSGNAAEIICKHLAV
jgi:UDP-GlcNAc3NAcA epimerase